MYTQRYYSVLYNTLPFPDKQREALCENRRSVTRCIIGHYAMERNARIMETGERSFGKGREEKKNETKYERNYPLRRKRKKKDNSTRYVIFSSCERIGNEGYYRYLYARPSTKPRHANQSFLYPWTLYFGAIRTIIVCVSCRFHKWFHKISFVKITFYVIYICTYMYIY